MQLHLNRQAPMPAIKSMRRPLLTASAPTEDKERLRANYISCIGWRPMSPTSQECVVCCQTCGATLVLPSIICLCMGPVRVAFTMHTSHRLGVHSCLRRGTFQMANTRSVTPKAVRSIVLGDACTCFEDVSPQIVECQLMLNPCWTLRSHRQAYCAGQYFACPLQPPWVPQQAQVPGRR